MNLERLEQYRDLKREIETIKRRLADVKAKAMVQVCDTVQASETEFPYISRTLPISGYSVKCTAQHKKLAAQYDSRSKMLFRETAAIKAWIATLHEDRIKRIFELRYLDGLSWESVALRVYGRACGDAARKRVVRFFEEKT